MTTEFKNQITEAIAQKLEGGMSQNSMAQKTGVSAATIHFIKKGEYYFPIKAMLLNEIIQHNL